MATITDLIQDLGTEAEGLAFARDVLRIEADALDRVREQLDGTIARAADVVHRCSGAVIVTGMGKAGLVGQKVAATLASTGTRAYPLHPGEAIHGDLGRVRGDDVVIALSQSGETDEVLRIVPAIRRLGATLIAITERASSSLGRASDLCVALGPIAEACPLGLAPSASSTAIFVPPRLVGATATRASTLQGVGPGVSLTTLSGWFSITKGVHSMMIAIPIRWLAATTLTFGLGATCLMGLPGPNSQDPPANPVPAPRSPDADKPPAIPGADLPKELNRVSMPDYVVEPPDKIVVEVLEALPGRPITGERLVRPDGTISLGYYGQVHVDSLTTGQIKVKVIEHLLEFLTAAQLGLEVTKDDKFLTVPPPKSTKVFVDVVSYNSKVYYVQGDVGTPGRLPITGNERVLDAIVYAGGLIPTASVPTMRLVRPDPRAQGQEHVYPIDYDAIVSKGDTTTNYQLMPGDRVVVFRKPVAELPKVPDPEAEFQARFREVERKLDLILNKLDIPDKP